METKKLIQSQHRACLQQRQLHDDTWQDCMDYLMPFRGDISTLRSEGSDRMEGIFDTTAMISAMDHVNFLKGSIVPSGSRWVKFRPGRALRDNEEARQALYATQERVLEAVEDSNFYPVVGQFLYDFVVIGNAAMRIKEDRKFLRRGGERTFGGLACEAVPMRRVVWKFGPSGRLDAVMREMEMAAYQAAAFFENPGKATREALEDDPETMVKFVHSVHKNTRPFGSSDIDQPFVSRFFATSDDWEQIDMGGFGANPYIGARWYVTDGEQYGRGPGHIARPDAKGANELKRKMLQAVAFDLDPPLGMPSADYFDFDMGEGGTFIFEQDLANQRPEFLRANARLDYANAILGEDRAQIDRAMMGDLIRGPETEPRSAYESMRREAKEKRRFATPADTVRHEFLSPAIDTIVNVMLRAGELPELQALAEEQGGETEVKYDFVSPFFVSQKQEQVERTLTYVQQMIELANATQDMRYMDRVDPDKLQQFVSIENEIPIDVLRAEEEVQAERQARAQQQAAAEQRAELEARSEAIRNVTPALREENLAG